MDADVFRTLDTKNKILDFSSIKVAAGETGKGSRQPKTGAEGATAPESLRHPDRSDIEALESRGHLDLSPKM